MLMKTCIRSHVCRRSVALTMLRYFILVALVSHVACADKKYWWKYANIYEIWIWSYKDSDGDGNGDLKGITMKLDYLQHLGIDSIWLSPFYESPLVDMGYDISNFTNVNPIFGTLEDFQKMCREAKKREIKVLIDVVINHSSDEHEWFQKSVKRIKPYDEYYVWKDAKGFDATGKPIPPNNWLSIFGGSSWEWNDDRKQFYLHHFHRKQVDLNLRNENLKSDLKKMLKFWIDLGVNGFRMDATGFYFEDPLFRDEVLINPDIRKDQHSWRNLVHEGYTRNLAENYEFLHELRLFTDEISRKKKDYEIIMIAEDYANEENTLRYYGTKKYPVVHYPFIFDLTLIFDFYNASSFNQRITHRLKQTPKHGVPLWVVENHDVNRIGSKLVDEYIDIMNIIQMLVPGAVCVYYGQEIGMLNGPVRLDQKHDSLHISLFDFTRDSFRTPMQWDNTINGGFTQNHKSWLPINPNYWHLNVKTQKQNERSHYAVFRALSQLRKTNTCKYGKFESFVLSTWIYGFTRTLEGHNSYMVITNLGTETEVINLAEKIPNLGPSLYVLIASGNADYKAGEIVKIKSVLPHRLTLPPMSALVLCYLNSKIACKAGIVF